MLKRIKIKNLLQIVLNKRVINLLILSFILISCLKSEKEIVDLGKEIILNNKDELNELVFLFNSFPDTSDIYFISISHVATYFNVRYSYDYMKEEGFETNDNFKTLYVGKEKEELIRKLTKPLNCDFVYMVRNKLIVFTINERNKKRNSIELIYYQDKDFLKKDYASPNTKYFDDNKLINYNILKNQEPYLVFLNKNWAIYSF